MALTNYKTVFKVDFKPTLIFYERLFSIASSFTGFPNWITTGLTVTLQDFEAWCSVTLAHNTVIYIRDVKEQRAQGDDERRIRAIVDNVPEKMGITELTRVGLRCWYLYPVKMTFENLTSIVADKFVVQNKEIQEGICPQPIDIAYNVHFMNNDLRVQLRVGPLAKDEIETQFQVDRNANLPVSKRVLPKEELFAAFPDVSLLIDIDVLKNEVRRGDLWQTYVNAHRTQTELSENIIKYVLGREEKKG